MFNFRICYNKIVVIHTIIYIMKNLVKRKLHYMIMITVNILKIALIAQLLSNVSDLKVNAKINKISKIIINQLMTIWKI